MKIALIGTRGVPAQYGGFETCVEEVGRRLVALGHDVHVYCRATEDGQGRPSEYLGMKLFWLPALRKRSLETLSHTGLSVAHLLFNRTDVAIVFNAANAPWLPLINLARIPVATHVDGLEWKRAKWGGLGKRYYRFAETLSVNLSQRLISDAKGIRDYYTEEFGVPTELIKYGAPILERSTPFKLADHGIEAGKYHLVVARFEPENHVDVIVEGYAKANAKFPLIVVGAAPYADDYTKKVHELSNSNVHFLGAVWDQELLNELYSHAYIYWHGHSVGGTNPSLLRALGAGTATNAFDVDFNKEVLLEAGRFFSDSDSVASLLQECEAESATTARRAIASAERASDYDWDDVAQGYESLAQKLLTGKGLASKRKIWRRKRSSNRQRALASEAVKVQ